MLIFKDYFKAQLPDYILTNDSYKDSNGKGFVERYVEIFGEELDEQYYPKIVNLSKEFSPLEITNPAYLDYFATLLGDIPRYLEDDEAFSFVITYLLSIYKAKGTKKSFKAILGTLEGISSVEIFEYFVGQGVYDDSPLIYYDTGVAYDEGCKTCSEYDINITATTELTAELFKTIKDLISLVEPINARLKNINWNDSPIVAVYISVEIDGDGNLLYNNDNDPGLILTLVNGDLIVDGPNADKYFIDSNGDLYYVI